MNVDLHMFGSLMLNRVCGKIDSTDVVTIDNSGPVVRAMKLKKKIA